MVTPNPTKAWRRAGLTATGPFGTMETEHLICAWQSMTNNGVNRTTLLNLFISRT
jgi:hypothetical protein